MIKKIIDDIVWWIPIKKLRNQIRNLLLDLCSKIEAFNEYIELANNERNIINNRINHLELQQSQDIIFKNTSVRDLYLRYIINNLDFDSLPDQFVLKSNVGHASKYMIVVKDKTKLDINEAKLKMYDWLNPVFSYINAGLELSVQEPKHLILAEEYIPEIEKDYRDFGIYCTFGKILYIIIYYDKTYYQDKKCAFYDENWNKLDMVRPGYTMVELDKPKHLERMKEIAKILSKDLPITRIDFYNLEESILVSEITNLPVGGHEIYNPICNDYKYGELIDLTKIPKEHLLK